MSSSQKELMNLTLAEVAAMLGDSASNDLNATNTKGVSRIIGNESAGVQRIQMDSRNVQVGDLFIALKGERFDAHDFLKDIATVEGVCALVKENASESVLSLSINAICVEDTLACLGQLAAAWRLKHMVPLIAVTGSNGKTTVTQMIASVLKEHAGEDALATKGNLNNNIGVPQTLLRLRAHHTCAVAELGMNHPGEIAYLADLVKPSVALVNNAQREHQEFMNSVEAVAIENAQVIKSLTKDGIAVFPADDEYSALWASMCEQNKYMTFSTGQVFAQSSFALGAEVKRDSDICLLSADFSGGGWHIKVKTPLGIVETKLQIAGQHNVKNALAAISSCIAMGVPLDEISKGLESFEPVKGRSRSVELKIGERAIVVVDDTYIANPDSVLAAIDVLSSMSVPRLLVLGDMGEVGSEGPQYHTEVGTYAASKGVTALYAVGELTKHSVIAFNNALKEFDVQSNHHKHDQKRGLHFDSMQALNSEIKNISVIYTSLLVKGSRFMKMENFVSEIEKLSQIKTSSIANLNTHPNALKSAHIEEGACS